MTAPKLAISNPAALTFRVGQGGENLIHDVALVQALLGLKRAKNGRMYLRDNHVTGKFDRATADALKQFRTEHRDTTINRPLARSGRMLNNLAQGSRWRCSKARPPPTNSQPWPSRARQRAKPPSS